MTMTNGTAPSFLAGLSSWNFLICTEVAGLLRAPIGRSVAMTGVAAGGFANVAATASAVPAAIDSVGAGGGPVSGLAFFHAAGSTPNNSFASLPSVADAVDKCPLVQTSA